MSPLPRAVRLIANCYTPFFPFYLYTSYIIYVYTMYEPDLSEPDRNSILLVSSHVKVDDSRRQERRQRYQDHVDAEKRTYNKQEVCVKRENNLTNFQRFFV